MTKQLQLVLCFLFLAAWTLPIMGQRKMEKMDRGIVAIPKTSSQMYISWRHFATDPDDIAYNIYYKTSSSGALTKLNSTPITKSTNYTANLSTATNAYTFVIKSVLNNTETEEPGSYTAPRYTGSYYSRIVKDYNFAPLPTEYGSTTAGMKFCWPADLDGDGKYDFVLDRHPGSVESDEESDTGVTSALSTLVEAYSSEGVFNWRIKMGVNVKTTEGHADMVTTYDMDGDGKAEVLMCVSEGTTFADGTVVTAENGTVTDYTGKVGSAPQWLSVVNGETGIEMDRILLPRLDEIKTTRSDKWKNITGHFIIAYLDGIHPSLIYQYKNRQGDDSFTGVHAAWRYINGKLELQWSNLVPVDAAQFHQVRVGDVDGDGCDEFVEGGYVLDHDGSMLSKNTTIVHGDRHCLADIDPDRPGLEHFFIQQYNPNTLGMGLYDAETGELIKGIYQSSVGDVGRGICAAFDTRIRGMQFFSTMNSNAMYNSKGKLISGATGTFPAEALWWGADLSRRHVTSSGNDKNPTMDNYNLSSKSFGREVSLYKEDNGHGDYYFRAPNGGRAAFWGDLFGDWREELIYCRTNNTGFVIVATWDETNIRQYTLMQNPAYRGQTTARGYYQTADVDFYMAADMPAPPIAPIQKADLYYTGSGWIDDNEANASYADGKSIMFDLRGGNTTYSLTNNMSPSRLWLMNPKGKDYTFSGAGKFTGTMDVVKSMQGDVTFNSNYDYTGITRISEGRLFVNGTLASKVQVDARGVIGGNATLNGGISLETGLNVEGGRIEPGVAGTLGTLTIVGNLDLPGRNNLAFDVDQTQVAKNDLLSIQGNFNVTGTNHAIIINPVTTITSGELALITFTGTTNATTSNFSVKGLEGIPYVLKIESNAVKLEVTEPRSAGSVVWKGGESSLWDFQAKNFLNGTNDDNFVSGDVVTFNDDAVNKTIVISETMPVSEMIFNNNTDYKISGEGSIGGTGSLKKTGTGKLSLLNEDNSFTGGIEIDGGTLEVASLKDGGLSSSIGASSNSASNWIMKNATLQTAGQMATNRNMQVEGTLTVNNPTTNNSVLMSGNITGTNIGLEVIGKGMLTLQGNNTISKATIKDGLLLLGSTNGNYNSLKNTNVTLQGGTLKMFDITSSTSNSESSFNIEVPEGVTASFEASSRWTLKGNLTGKGTLNFKIPKNDTPRLDLNGNWSTFEGTVNVTGTDFRVNNNYGYEKMTLNLAASGVSAYHLTSGRIIKLGGLIGVTGSKLSGASTTWTINNTTNNVFNGTIEGASSKLTKEGVGTFTLTGANSYTGGTTINGGKLIISNTTGSATGTGSVMLYNNAILGGTGIITGNVTMYGQSGIDLQNSKFETLTVEKDLRLTSNGSVTLDVSRDGKNSSDCIKVGGTVYLTGTLNLTPTTGAFAIGNSYKILNASAINGSFASITTELPEGMQWDQTLISSGIIQIVSTTAISNVKAENISIYPNPVQANAYINMGGLTGKVVIECISVSGVCVYKQGLESSGGIEEIDLSGLSAGSYLLRIYSEDYPKITKKIIKQ